MSLFVQRLFDALENGAVYAALALALAIIYKATGHLNFAQGEMAMFSAFIAYVLSVEQGLPAWLAIVISMLLAALAGAGIERVLVRPLEERNPLSVVIVTLGLFLIIGSVAQKLWLGVPRVFNTPFPDSSRSITIFDAQLRWRTVWYWVTLLVVMGLLWVLLERTRIGLAFRAVASSRESARLVGVEVGRMLSLGWALAGALGALAGAIAAGNNPSFDTNLMAPLLIYAFAAVTLGGLDSPIGAIVGALIVAVVETMASGYLDAVGGELAQATALVLIVVVLLFRPSGLFGSTRVERV
jgi:branched-chain amino acid transport system permease protein